MKTFTLFLISLIMAVAVQAQSIVDKESYVSVVYRDGTSISIQKNQVESLKIQGSKVYIMTSRKWDTDALTKIISLSPSEFGYSSSINFYNHLNRLFFSCYRVAYSYNLGMVDTVSYFAGDSLAYRIVYTYTGGSVSGKSEPINE